MSKLEFQPQKKSQMLHYTTFLFLQVKCAVKTIFYVVCLLWRRMHDVAHDPNDGLVFSKFTSFYKCAKCTMSFKYSFKKMLQTGLACQYSTNLFMFVLRGAMKFIFTFANHISCKDLVLFLFSKNNYDLK